MVTFPWKELPDFHIFSHHGYNAVEVFEVFMIDMSILLVFFFSSLAIIALL